jgi:opacity protein-like surface antigen
MKKLAISLATSMFIFVQAHAGDLAIGVTANFAFTDTSGTETLRDSGKKTNATHEEDVVIPEIFIESVGDRGAFGIAYVPITELGSKSRTDAAVAAAAGGAENDTGAYKAEAEVADHIMVYVDYNIADLAGQTVYLKGGVSRATIKTLEAFPAGGGYGNEDVFGYTVGLGARADIGSNMFYKVEGTYTDYDELSVSGADNTNKIVADTEIMSAKFSLGYKF